MEERFEELIDGYAQNGVGVSRHFLPQDLAMSLRQNLESLYLNGQTVLAGVGDANNRVVATAIRRDKIFWIEPDTTNISELQFIAIVEDFVAHLNATCYTGINAYEFHYAVYEEGSYYKRHKDQFKTNSARKFSFVIYLNENWEECNGGQLVLYSNNGVEQSELPTNRKAVFFRSDDLEHEVLPVNKKRLSIVGWLKSV
ncbi:MAG: 2OG-Fe(II) oxygenase [Flavipsychrobacter sp.]